MFNVIFEPQFLTYYQNIKKNHPEISKELATALTELKMPGQFLWSINHTTKHS